MFYLPLLLRLFRAPVRDKSVAVRRYAVRGFADIVDTMRATGTQPVLTAMTSPAGITVGVFGAATGIHWSLGVSAALLLALLCLPYHRAARKS
ncbi:hypothetical protein [Bradyrhizobium manausense]|uniref:hypothetical protein n=1 Tax=Bradyrhizobium manausense TaxID=989370 RepID=UPI002012669C|nr:hypothetical protein [Bradyrhizobium manausense]